MKYCMNLLLWNSEVTDAELTVAEQLKEMGYDGVELPLFAAGPATSLRGGGCSMIGMRMFPWAQPTR